MSANTKPPLNEAETHHATCVDFNGKGVLLIGKSGAGKSDLALRLIKNNQHSSNLVTLVSDDRVCLTALNNILIASPPKPLEGLLEVRGVGLCHFDFLASTSIYLLVKLDKNKAVERLPDFSQQQDTIVGITIPYIVLNPFESSAPLKISAALEHLQAH